MGAGLLTITFRKDFGAWWPDYDHAPEKCFGFVQRGLTDMDYAVGEARGHQLAVQAGGHVGFWPLRLARSFTQVFSFECEPILFRCLDLNTNHQPRIIISQLALGPEVGPAAMRGSSSAGSWRIDPEGGHAVEQTTIDAQGYLHCDAIFLDIEGYEAAALRGAAETIKRFHPIIHVEELPRSVVGIRAQLSEMGYRPVHRVHNDCVYLYDHRR